jgi:hypothetical protein
MIFLTQGKFTFSWFFFFTEASCSMSPSHSGNGGAKIICRKGLSLCINCYALQIEVGSSINLESRSFNKLSQRWFRKKLPMQGTPNLRNETYLLVSCNDEGEAQPLRWTYYETIKMTLSISRMGPKFTANEARAVLATCSNSTRVSGSATLT